MENFPLTLQATLHPDKIQTDFNSLFVSGPIADSDLDRRITELSRMFKVYANSCPAPFWAKGLAVTDELCRVTEMFLDHATIRRALLRLVRKSLRIHCLDPPLISRAEGWIRLLQVLPLWNESPNPASLIAWLAGDDAARVRFLFSVYLPSQFGGSFGRYPGQLDFLRRWITGYVHSSVSIPCLDAACGSGEGSYELAGTLLECGINACRISVTGVTISPLEVFAAAHACFPHDSQREARYRASVASFAKRGSLPDMRFIADDLKSREPSERYRVIICNGILGGPFLHERNEVEDVLRRLVESLHSGGIFLAADRFHGGWKKHLPRSDMEALLYRCGLEILQVSEGVAAMKR